MAARNYSSYGDRSDVTERVVSLNRVAKVEKGGRRFSFSALIVVGDLNGRVGAGLGKAREVPEAIRKGVEIAKKNMITVPMVGTTIPHEVRHKWGAAKVLLKPAAPGTGVISGGAMRAVIELAGVKDILTKSLGTNNPINTVRATMSALQSLRTAQEIAELRGKELEEIVGRRLAGAYREAAAKGTISDRSGGRATAAPVGAPTPAETAAASTATAPPAARPAPAAARPPAATPPAATPPAATPPAATPPAATPPAATPPAATPPAATPPAVDIPPPAPPAPPAAAAPQPVPPAPPEAEPPPAASEPPAGEPEAPGPAATEEKPS